MINRFIQLGICALFFLMTSCVSINSLQDGKTLGRNNLEIGMNADLSGLTNLVVVDENIHWAQFETVARIGVLEKLDIGIKFNNTAYAAMNAKYQILGDQKSIFASSLGLEFGANIIAETKEFYGLVTSYNSLSFFENNVHFIFSPKYAFQRDAKLRTTDERHMLGLSYGLLVGNKIRMGIETTHFRVFNGINLPQNINQYSICMTYRISAETLKKNQEKWKNRKKRKRKSLF